MKARAWVFALGLVAFASVAHAQQQSTETPAAAIDQRGPAAPARRQPDEPSFADKARQWADDTQIMGRIAGTVDGWYPRFGGLTSGSGLGVGPGYRTHVLGNVLVDVSGAISIRNYKAVDGKVRWLQALGERAEIWTNYRYEDSPQEHFFGIGPDTLRDRRTSYRFSSNDVVLRGLFHATTWLDVGADLGYMSPSIGRGRDPEFPSTEQLFTAADTPGLTTQPNFFHRSLFVDADRRERPGNPSGGGIYHASFSAWDDGSLGQYDFHVFEAIGTHFFPVTADKRHVISGHAGVSVANNAFGEQVPFYFLPYVGGANTIRGYREYRFTDENALWFGTEYIWTAATHVSVIPFLDAGKVTHKWDQMDLSGLKTGYGIGFAVHTPKQQLTRIDVAYGEGLRMVLRFGMF